MELPFRQFLYATLLLVMAAALAANVWANQLTAEVRPGYYPALAVPGHQTARQ